MDELTDKPVRLAGRPAPRRRRPHALVIGGGFGGLAAAVRLGARGYRVTVLERLDAPGGRAYVNRQDGFTFDSGPTMVTAPFLLKDLWDIGGRKLEDDVELRPISPFYRIRFDDGETFDTCGDPETMRVQVARFSARDAIGYERFMAASEAIFRVGFERLGHVPFNSWTDMLRIVPDMIKLASHRTVYDMVATYVENPRLRIALSLHPLLIGGNPFTTTSIYCLIAFLERQWGVHFVVGGTGRLVEGLVRLIHDQEGLVRCGEEVSAIAVTGRTATGARLACGHELDADIVVSNVDSAWTYRYLLPPDVRRRWTNRRIERARYSMSLFVWYFGTNRRYPDVAHHTMVLGPRYRELLADIFERKVLAADFSLYLHRPTANDSSLAPQGCDAFYVLSPVPHLGNGLDWRRISESYRRAIAHRLQETVLPDLEAHVVTSCVMTPQDFQDRLRSFRGAAFGLAPVFSQSAWFRPHNRSEDIDRLYLVGAGTHPGAGLPGVLSSARVLDAVVPEARALV